ncbi:MAG: ATP-binding protein [Chitinispirillales bacterium]|jgi:predicted AAA+ superfamily ATPase|nr:ATP-binding protein [Chitinispirillales bacterium]
MIPRNTYLQKIVPFIDTDLVKIFTGIRRCGKSVMLDLIKDALSERGVKKKQFVSMNFEDIETERYRDYQKLHEHISAKINKIDGKAYLFLDEIQEVGAWEKCVNSLRVKFDCDIYITGSNANLLSGEFATYLGGRYVEIVIYPFSFAEFIELYRSQNESADVEKIFKEYLLVGGMPYLKNVGFNYDASVMYLQDLYNSVVLKDIVRRNQIRSIDLFERVIKYVIANIGTTFSASGISNYFKSEKRDVAVDTILNHLRYSENAHLLSRVRRKDIVGKKTLAVSEKYYIADHGLREAVIGKNQQNISLTLENIVFMELKRRGYNVCVGKINGFEIDFIAEKNNACIYVQVCYLLASNQTVEREFSVLEKIKDNYPKFVVSLDEFDMSRNGIKHLNIRKFLLDSNW